MIELFFNGIGFVGLGLFLWAYGMINLGLWNASDWRTHAPNLAGALCMIVSLLHHWNLPTFILEVFWAGISIYGLWRARKAD